jgi:hypothetical protein
MLSRLPLLALAVVLALPGGLAAQSKSAPKSFTKKPEAPAAELNEPTLYEFLLGEIALQRGDAELAAQTYLELARRTGDARVARRAVEVANQGRLPDLALEAARTWYRIEPDSPQALQVVALLLVAAKRVDDAEPYL